MENDTKAIRKRRREEKGRAGERRARDLSLALEIGSTRRGHGSRDRRGSRKADRREILRGVDGISYPCVSGCTPTLFRILQDTSGNEDILPPARYWNP